MFQLKPVAVANALYSGVCNEKLHIYRFQTEKLKILFFLFFFFLRFIYKYIKKKKKGKEKNEK